MARHLLNGTLIVLTLAYPIIVYFGLARLPVGAFALMLAVLFAARTLLSRDTSGAGWILTMVVIVFALVVWLAGSEQLLLFYPVLINACLLAGFAYTLVYPPSAIERLARLTEPELPASGVRYTRVVTWVWCAFFLINGAIAAITTADLSTWTLYNGLISYVLIGTLFAVEYVVRRRFRRMHADEDHVPGN